MRLFTKTVMQEFVEGTTERFSHVEDYALLGRCDTLVYQLRCGKVAGTDPTVTLAVYHSNDAKDWKLLQLPVNAQGVTAGTSLLYMNDTSGAALKLGTYVRFGVTLGGTTPAAEVELLACGRGEQL